MSATIRPFAGQLGPDFGNDTPAKQKLRRAAAAAEAAEQQAWAKQFGCPFPAQPEELRRLFHAETGDVQWAYSPDLNETVALRIIETSLLRRQAASNTAPDARPPVGYVALKTLLDKVGGNYAKAHRIITAAKIGTWKPTPKAQRLFVDAAAWLNHLAAEKPPDDAAIERFIDGAAKRKAEIKIGKRPGRKPKTLPRK